MTLTNTGAGESAHPDAKHVFDYYYRPGRQLRPSPSAFANVADDPQTAAFVHVRRMLAPSWYPFREEPPDTPLTQLLADHRWQGDELMDDVVRMFARVGAPRGREWLDQALDHGIDSLDDPPVELVNLFRQLDAIPQWYTPEVFELGRSVWVRSTVAGKLAEFLTDIVGTALTYEVGSATGAAGRFQRDPLRRNLETFAFFAAVTRKGGMERFSDAFKDVVRVRLMHAQVRGGLRRAWGGESFAAEGSPISNSAMAQGAYGFGLAPMLFDEALGRPCSIADLDAACVYWGYIVYVLGVSEAIIPKNARESIELGDYMLATGSRRSVFAEELSRALTGFIYSAATDNKPFASALTRRVGLPLLFGYLTVILGEPLIREMVAGTDLAGTNLRRWSIAGRAVATIDVRFARLRDRLPLANYARRRLNPHVDPLFDLFDKMLRSYVARKNGPTRTPYDSHDHSRPGDFASPGYVRNGGSRTSDIR